MTVRQEQVLKACSAGADKATAAVTLADIFTEVERAKTRTLIAAARPRSPSTPCRQAEDDVEPLTEGEESLRFGRVGDIPAVWGGVLNPGHAPRASFSRGNGDAVSVGCLFWSPA
jgi:hypothetical protein